MARTSTDAGHLSTLGGLAAFLVSVTALLGGGCIAGVWRAATAGQVVPHGLVALVCAVLWVASVWVVVVRHRQDLIWVSWDAEGVKWGRYGSRVRESGRWRDVRRVDLYLGPPVPRPSIPRAYELRIAFDGPELAFGYRHVHFRKVGALLDALASRSDVAVSQRQLDLRPFSLLDVFNKGR